jgi:hypothetical protein
VLDRFGASSRQQPAHSVDKPRRALGDVFRFVPHGIDD